MTKGVLEMATRKKATPPKSRSTSSIFDSSRDTGDSLGDLRESFFKDADPVKGGTDFATRAQELFQAFAGSVLFRTKKSVAIVTAVVTLIVTMSFSSLFAPNQLDTTTLAARISGGVALTEPELRDVVKSIGQTVYWAGGMRGAKYTINAQNVNTIYVRYLPDGKGISDQTPKYRVIATYKQVNAYDATLTAGNQENGVSFAKPNGSVVYYNKNVPTNVYVAYKAKPYQIEIFDPTAEQSLNIANSASALQVIK
jgi:hypothetical protein